MHALKASFENFRKAVGFAVTAILLGSSTASAIIYEVDPQVVTQQELNRRVSPVAFAIHNADNMAQRLQLLKQHKTEIMKDIDSLPYFDVSDSRLSQVESKTITLSRVLIEYQTSLELIPDNLDAKDCRKTTQEIDSDNQTSEAKSDIVVWTHKLLAEICR